MIHIAFNMLALWWLGAPVEMVLGRVRFLGLYLVSGLAGAAGALVANPNAVTVGASGAIFGLLGAGLILEWQATGSIAGNYLTLILINLAISFAVPGISIGGHIGGLIGGILATLAFSRFGRGHAAYGKLGLLGVASLLAIAAGSVLISYWKVRGLAPRPTGPAGGGGEPHRGRGTKGARHLIAHTIGEWALASAGRTTMTATRRPSGDLRLGAALAPRPRPGSARGLPRCLVTSKVSCESLPTTHRTSVLPAQAAPAA